MRGDVQDYAVSLTTIQDQLSDVLSNGNTCPCLQTSQVTGSQETNVPLGSYAAAVKSTVGEDMTKINNLLDQLIPSLHSNLNSTLTREAQNMTDAFRDDLEQMKDTVVGAIKNLKNNGVCPCLSRGGVATKGKEKAKVTDKAASEDAELSTRRGSSDNATMQRLEASIAALIQQVGDFAAQLSATQVPSGDIPPHSGLSAKSSTDDDHETASEHEGSIDNTDLFSNPDQGECSTGDKPPGWEAKTTQQKRNWRSHEARKNRERKNKAEQKARQEKEAKSWWSYLGCSVQ